MKNNSNNGFNRFSIDSEGRLISTPPPASPPSPPLSGKTGKSGKLPVVEPTENETLRNKPQLEARDFHPIRQRRDGRSGFLGGLMYFIFVISISVILACVGWMAASDVLALNKEEITADVTLLDEFFTEEEIEVIGDDGRTTKKIVQVADVGQVASVLKDAGIIEYTALFRLYSSISDVQYKVDPGTYKLSTMYDYRAIVKKMQFGSDSQVRTMVTFPEGFTMRQIFQRLEENKICKYKDLMEAAANYDFDYSFLENIPLGEASRLEGFLFPDTYEFYQGMTPQAAINTFLLIFHYKLTQEMLDIAAERGFTMRDVVNMASLIEKESANDEERPEIAGVIYNRLNAGMALGVDATSIYSHQDYEGNPADMITTWVQDTSDPYNTRHNLGLPPTPICSPGFASIMAVLKPNTTNNYYYALDEATGEHRFFTNYNDHQAFVATQSYG